MSNNRKIMEENKKKKLVVMGAGLAGSLAAVYMARRGYAVEVYERRGDTRVEQSYEGKSINLALSARGRRALRSVGIEDLVVQQCPPMDGRVMHDTNGALSYMPYGQSGECILSVGRQMLNEVLIDCAEGKLEECKEKYNVKFHFNKKATNFDPRTNEITFEDGETIRPDIVIGADGASSVVRAGMLRSPGVNFSQKYMEHGYKELCIPPGPDGDYSLPTPRALHIWPRNEFMLIALPNPGKDWTVTLFLPWADFNSLGDDERKIEEFFKTTFPDVVPLIPDLVDQYKKNPTGYLGIVHLSPWNYKSTSIVLGDAAHAIVPFFGQGMNASLEDVFVLNEILDQTDDDWGKALPMFSEKRIPDARAISEFSEENYFEMRAYVASKWFLFRTAAEKVIQRMIPSFIPKYGMVAFTTIPYSEVKEKDKRQRRVLDILFSPLIMAIPLVAGALFVAKRANALPEWSPI